MSYDGPYCSERMGDNYSAGTTAEEMYDYYGEDLYYEPEHVAAVERHISEEAQAARIRELERENQVLREQLEDRWTHDPSRDGAGCSWCGAWAMVDADGLCEDCF